MNSEELEQSLRTEFENYLKDVFAEMRQSVSEFQTKINTDFEKHKEELDKSLGELNEKFGNDKELEVSFTESVSEHLKLARDEGARITATAIAEAERLDEEQGPDFTDLSNAIKDISEKDSQSEILKTLVNHAAAFTPRGAFFIVKNEHLVGWRVFGREQHEDPKVVREVFFPVSTETALSEAVESLMTISSAGSEGEDDLMYRNKLGFENPEHMYAIPLIARGRGVAVLYADSGTEGGSVNLAAIEALMRVAGLTVEVLASAPPVSRKKEEAETTVEEPAEVPQESTEGVGRETYGGSFETEPAAAAQPAYEPAADADKGSYESEYVTPEADSFEDETATYDFQPISEPQSGFEPVADAQTSVWESPAADIGASKTDFEKPVVEEHHAGFEEAAEDVPSWEQPQTESDAASFVDQDSYDSEFDSSSDSSPAFEAYDEGINQPYTESETAAADEYSFDAPAASEEYDHAAESTEAPYSFEGQTETVSESYEFEETAEVPIAEDSYSFEQPTESVFEESAETPVEPDAYSFEEQPETPVEMESTFEEFTATPVETVTAYDSFVESETDELPEIEQEEPEAAPPVRSRFADRNLDLPIEVGEDERRLHNDARRFARLLVSEIKLYNEQKVKEGRESSDLYERLREAIDRSREMYDKRVQPPVAAKFDYFNYELVNTLAEGDEGKLGGSYPGAAI